MSEYVVKTERRLDSGRAAALEETFKEALQSEADTLILDMSETIFISSAPLRGILKLQKALMGTGRTMLLRGVTSGVMEVFDVTGYSGFLNFEESL